MKALVFFLFLYPPLVAIKLLAVLLGFIIVPIAIPFGYVTKPNNDKRKIYKGWKYRVLPSWADGIWGNDKYGAYGNYFWPEIHPDPTSFYAQFKWLAVRNPANNLNNFRLFKPEISSADIVVYGTHEVSDTKGKAGCQLTTAGWLAGLYWILPYGIDWLKKLPYGRSLKVRLGFEISHKTNGPVSLSVIIHPYAKFGREAK